ncbi:MAG: hypothetical protein JRN52_04310 [Nitrososphaerota archaeon]|nr:hypothetical protein [Nitrososphaerota archaeon]
MKARNDAILLFDGAFLLRPELYPFWNLDIFLNIDFFVAFKRSCLRDPEFVAKPVEVLTRICSRYMEGNQLYADSVKPKDLADVVVDNNDLKNLKLQIKNRI